MCKYPIWQLGCYDKVVKKYLYQDLYELEEKHWWHTAKRKTCLSIIKKYVKVKKPAILDIGCGTGKNLEEFSKIGTAYGIDSSSVAIKFCKKKRGLNNVSLGSAENTGFADGKLDVVSMLDVLEHTDDVKTIKETSRILKDRGYLLITVPAYQWMWSNWDVVLHHRRRYTKNQVEALLMDQGFETIKSGYLYSFLLIPVFVVRKMKNFFFRSDYPSDFKVGFLFFGKILGTISDAERSVALSTGIPFGLSLFVLARKRS